jgi:queuine tRNA-ribosyltransferase
MRLASIHNVHFLQDLVRDARIAILENRFVEFSRQFKQVYTTMDCKNKF